jgi:hypothetical protein
MQPDARDTVIEAYVPVVGEEAPPTISDTQVLLIGLHMMVADVGRERSLVEIRRAVRQGWPAPLRRVRTTPLNSGYVVIETAAA